MRKTQERNTNILKRMLALYRMVNYNAERKLVFIAALKRSSETFCTVPDMQTAVKVKAKLRVLVKSAGIAKVAKH